MGRLVLLAQLLGSPGGDTAPALTGERSVCIFRRMPRMQVYLPDDLYKSVKARRLPVSELLQEAVRAELRRLDLISESDLYLAELVQQVGDPSAQQRARARAVAREIGARTHRKKVG
jgi:hypothetical protein